MKGWQRKGNVQSILPKVDFCSFTQCNVKILASVQQKIDSIESIHTASELFLNRFSVG